MKLLNDVHAKAKKLINEGDPAWEEKTYGYFTEATYNQMVFKFWKPLRSFYDMKRFE